MKEVLLTHTVLADSPWGFGAETAAHTLRLILSGLFDRFPRLRIILGHLGEGLPFLLPRVEHRLRHQRWRGVHPRGQPSPGRRNTQVYQIFRSVTVDIGASTIGVCPGQESRLYLVS
jgi:predicted TIM-barrel fold metal-dependent hydrolase